MIDLRTHKDLKDFPILDNGKVYIYVMENEDKKVKIGLSTNIQQRYQSLCGSNSAGVNITKVLCSPATYLFTMEETMHTHFDKYRIHGTEWFQRKEDGLFDDIVEYLHLIFSSDSYVTCNKLRKKFNEERKK